MQVAKLATCIICNAGAHSVGPLSAGITAEFGILSAGIEVFVAAGADHICSFLSTQLLSVQSCAGFALAVLTAMLLGVEDPSAAGADELADRIDIPHPFHTLAFVHLLQSQLTVWR